MPQACPAAFSYFVITGSTVQVWSNHDIHQLIKPDPNPGG
jgi:hypothetical protein